MQHSEAEVLIIGAGPCGLMLANELGQRGIRAILADREETVATAPQANATQARSMEHYRRLGFAHEIRAKGLPQDYPTDVAYFTTYSGYELGRHRMPPSGQADRFVRDNAHIWNAAEMPHRIPQSLIEQTLLEKAGELDPITVAFNFNAEAFEETADGVTTRLKNTRTGAAWTVKSRYLFAADGTQSMVRRQLGIRYGGGEAAQRDFMGGRMLSVYVDLPTFYDTIKVEKAWMYWCFNSRRRGILAAVDGKQRFAFGTQLRPGEDADTMTHDDAARLVREAMGRDIPLTVAGTAQWVAGRALVAERFQSGRVLLGGDAVHVFTPTGGMGYNTAIEDAVNAGWKLAAVLKGQAGPGLLDSYEQERRPVALRNTRFALGFADSVGLFSPSPAIEDDGPAGEAARKRAGAYLVEHARNEFTIPGFTLGARYDTSETICKEDSLPPPDQPSVYAPSARPGGRAPHFWMPDGSSLFDNFGFEWTLLCMGTSSETAGAFAGEAARRNMPLTRLDLAGNGIAADLYQRAFALIRPDQIVAWRGDSASAEEAAAILDRVTGVQMSSHAEAVA